MGSIPEVVISNSDGVQITMPIIGMGTASQSDGHDTAKRAILEALKVGYRHFDTAALYGSEPPLGEAIADALRFGLIKSRDELFITTKLWISSTERHLVLPAIRKSLNNLGLDYVDLYLIHWPLKLNKDDDRFNFPVPAESLAAIDIKSVWEGMEECQNLGLTKSVGVSNFSSRRLEEILSFAKIPPAVNQVEMNVLWQQKELTKFCKGKGIVLTAYSPLGAPGTLWGDNRIFECDVLKDLANSKGKTLAQVSLRWLYEQGVSIITKSFNKERMKENLDILDWSLSAEELNTISVLPQRKGVYASNMAIESSDVLAVIDAEI